jgi:hypothetical protein
MVLLSLNNRRCNLCGLVGCAGSLTAQHENALKQLLIVNALRGAHSVGLAGVNSVNAVRVVKGAMLPQKFLAEKSVTDLFMGVNRVLIGHNRFATVGAINNENAHPFLFEHIAGAHNGSLRNVKLLPHHNEFEVDSQVLLNSIDKYGVEATEDKIHGAFALTWYDRRDQKLHMWRNDERPLWYCYTEDEKAIFWASEPAMIDLIFGRDSVKLKHKGFIEVTPNTHLIFHVDMAANVKMGAPEVHQRKKYVPPYTSPTNNYGYSNRYGRGSHWDGYCDDYAGWDKREVAEVLPEKKPNPLRLVGGSRLEGQNEVSQSPLGRSDLELLSKLKKRVEVMQELFSSTGSSTQQSAL